MSLDKHLEAGGIFITFSGNCRQALTFYQACFGGVLHLKMFDEQIPDFNNSPVIFGTLVSDQVIIRGSDLVHNEGRSIGNYISVFLSCKDAEQRRALIEKLNPERKLKDDEEHQNLVEVIDAYQVRWVIGVF